MVSLACSYEFCGPKKKNSGFLVCKLKKFGEHWSKDQGLGSVGLFSLGNLLYFMKKF
jgi:hypothetical protein